MRKHEEKPMPLVTAGHTTPGENNQFHTEAGKKLVALLGFVGAVVIAALLLLWLV
jgi:hypothetical protein